MNKSRKQIWIGVVALLIAYITYSYCFQYHSTIPITSLQGSNASTTLQKITKVELAQHDGSDESLPIYIGLDGYVYDVTPGRKFYKSGAVYHYLAGKDSSATLHIMGSETIKQKYPIIGVLVEK